MSLSMGPSVTTVGVAECGGSTVTVFRFFLRQGPGVLLCRLHSDGVMMVPLSYDYFVESLRSAYGLGSLSGSWEMIETGLSALAS